MTLTGPSGAGAAPTISPWSAPAPESSPRPAPAPESSPRPAVAVVAPSSGFAVISDPLPVVIRALAGAVAAQCPVRPGRVRPLEDPVLPGGEPAEDLRFAGFRAGKTEVGLHAGQRVRREAGPLLYHQPDLVRPVEIVRGLGDQAEPFRFGGGQVPPGGGGRGPRVGLAAKEPDLQPAQAAAHRQPPGVEVVHPEHRG